MYWDSNNEIWELNSKGLGFSVPKPRGPQKIHFFVYASSLSVMLLIMALSGCKSVSLNFSSHAVLDNAVSCRIFAPFVGSPRGADREQRLRMLSLA